MANRSLVRIQTHLENEQKSALEILSAQRGASMGKLIREAVHSYLTRLTNNYKHNVLKNTAGTWKNRKASNTQIRKIRAEWESRTNRKS